MCRLRLCQQPHEPVSDDGSVVYPDQSVIFALDYACGSFNGADKSLPGSRRFHWSQEIDSHRDSIFAITNTGPIAATVTFQGSYDGVVVQTPL